MSDFTDAVRERIRAEMQKRHISQRDMAGQLKWSQSRVAKIMKGRVEMGLSELEAMCFIVGLSKAEVVRDQGLEFCADLAPHELRALEHLRALPAHIREATLITLAHNAGESKRADVKRATPKKPIFGKPRPR